MSHLHKPWRVVEDIKRFRARYGENTQVIANHQAKVVLATPKHSFEHLLGKTFKVPDSPENQFSEGFVLTSYRITDADLLQQKKRRERIREEAERYNPNPVDNDEIDF